MTELADAPVVTLDPAQAAELALLVEFEARWENGRKAPSREQEAESTTQSLHGKQKAYDAFRAKLAAYNRRFTPAHIPELLLNTPSRLGKWCRLMRDLFLQVEHAPQSRCPVHLLEKAHRWADGVGARMNKVRVSRSTPPITVRDAIQELETLSQWCDDLAGVISRN